MSEPMKPGDPAYWMLQQGLDDPDKRSVPVPGVYSERCYICRDPEYALMGLPLCTSCAKCGGHVPADDCCCDKCGHDQSEEVPPVVIRRKPSFSAQDPEDTWSKNE